MYLSALKLVVSSQLNFSLVFVYFALSSRRWVFYVHSQPDTIVGIWNIRGILNNSWHRIEVNLKD